MKRKNGFTLIELLAVIVILAIIALIATPIVLNMINSARKKAAESSALGFIDAIEYNNGFAQSEQAGYTEITGTKTVSEINVKMKGKKPTGGEVVIDSNGKVTNATLCFNEYKVIYTPGSTSVEKGTCDGSSSSTPEPSGPTKVAAGANDTHKGIVYLNPTDLTVECTESNSQIGTGSANASGCMKFYIFDASGDTYKMILDHNTTARVAWNSNQSNASMGEVATALSTDTAGWVGSPRLITADEVAHIVGADSNDTIKWSSSKDYGTNDTSLKSSYFYLDGGRNSAPTTYSGSNGWQKQYANSTTPSNYAWLFDYTIICKSYGCSEEDSSTNGYWTSSTVFDRSREAWCVRYVGGLASDYVDDYDFFGVRPVITISKSQID